MIQSKEEFLQAFLPGCEHITFTQINLDITDLSIADILRNLHKAYPPNTRIRNAIASGTHAIGVLCKSETLDPLKGVFVLLVGPDSEVRLMAEKYIVISVPEDSIETEKDIKIVLDQMMQYLVHEYNNIVYDFANFFVRYVYDPEYDYKEEDEK